MIDPLTLAKQRGLRSVRTPRPTDAGGGTEGSCSRCGEPTWSKTGICRACRNGDSLPDPKTLPTDRIAAYVARCRAELERRRDELNAALGEQ